MPFTKGGYAASWMRASVQMHVWTEEATRNPCQELHNYLEANLQSDATNPVCWWGVSLLVLIFQAHTLHLLFMLPSTTKKLILH